MASINVASKDHAYEGLQLAYDILALQETRFDTTDTASFEAAAWNRGYAAYMVASCRGRHGGAAIIATRSHQSRLLEAHNSVHGDWVACLTENGCYVSAYCRPGREHWQGFDASLVRFAMTSGARRLVIAGDWNRTPEDASVLALAEILRVGIEAPCSPTRWQGSRTIDYFLARGALFCERPEASAEVRLGDHRLVRASLCGGAGAIVLEGTTVSRSGGRSLPASGARTTTGPWPTQCGW